jgi:hypothetical protein
MVIFHNQTYQSCYFQVAHKIRTLRYNIEDGIDLFSYLCDKDKIYGDYLEMLLTSIRRPDLVDHVQRWETSKQTDRQTGRQTDRQTDRQADRQTNK